MNVEDAPWELLHEPWREQAHVSGKTDQINLVLLQRSHDFAIMLGPVSALRRNCQRGKAKTTSGFNPARIRPVRNDHGDPSAGNPPSGDVPGDGLEVRAASGEEDAEI